MARIKPKPFELGDNLREFIESFPSTDEVRKRIARNAKEISFFKRLLRLAEDAQHCKEGEAEK